MLERLEKKKAALGLVLLSAFQVVTIYFYGYVGRWNYILMGLTGTAALFLLARLIEKHRIGEALVWVGQASLAIFLLSAFAQGATRVVLTSLFHTNNLLLQLLSFGLQRLLLASNIGLGLVILFAAAEIGRARNCDCRRLA